MNYWQNEKQFYDEIYSSDASFNDIELINTYLSSSQSSFLSLIENIAKDVKVLEIGCGNGELLEKISRNAKSVTGIDFSHAALKNSRRNTEGNISPNYIQMDIENLAFDDESFDLIVNRECLSSLAFKESMQELHRVLKPGGMLISLECLGDNPVYNLNRKINALRGKRTTWACQNIVTVKKLLGISDIFHLKEIRFYHLLAPLLGQLRVGNPGTIEKLDAWLLTNKFLQRFAFKAVFILERVA